MHMCVWLSVISLFELVIVPNNTAIVLSPQKKSNTQNNNKWGRKKNEKNKCELTRREKKR